MLRFDDISFAVLGLIAAAIPLIIHLLFRRRFRTVHWAAVTLLRQALESKRKTLRLRDLLVLALRMIAVIAFGLMLARPHFRLTSIGNAFALVLVALLLLGMIAACVAWATRSKKRSIGMLIIIGVLLVTSVGSIFGIASRTQAGSDSAFRSRQPVHAILLIDNSRSLGVESLGQSLLDVAKSKSIEFADALSVDSRITVIPIAGSESPISLDAYKSKDDAKRSIGRITLVDVAADLSRAVELAEEASLRTTSPSTKRVILLTDGQQNSWRNIDSATFARIPDVQIVNVTSTPARNVWVSDFQLEDGLASNEVPGRFLARIHSTPLEQGPIKAPIDGSFDVQIRLSIDGVDVASQSMSLLPGQEREVEFLHQFTTQADPAQPISVVATIAIHADSATADSLMRDNQQQIVVPIVASLPIIFVDQYGDQENLEQAKIGETYALRHLMAPRSATEDSSRRLIQIEHVRPDEVSQERLQSARLVVIGGVESPTHRLVTLLREFVAQGGPLVILAGGPFDPVAWTEQGWLNGQGILPVPLDPNFIGETPEEAQATIKPFYASFASMQHDFFQIENEDAQTLESLFKLTPFFKAVRCELKSDFLEKLFEGDRARFVEDETFLEHFTARQRSIDMQNPISEIDQQHYRTLNPTWWNWRTPSATTNHALDSSAQAKLVQPRALALFDDLRHPFVIERRIGAGQVIFFTSGVTSNWNLLRNSGAMYLFHRTFCRLMEQTLPRQNFTAGERMPIPCETQEGTQYTVTRPDGRTEPLSLEQTGDGSNAVAINHALTAGLYTVSSETSTPNNQPSSKSGQNRSHYFAVIGVESESDLAAFSSNEIKSKLGHDTIVLSVDQAIRIEGSYGAGRDLWKQFGYLLLGCLLIETIILGTPWLRTRPA